MRKKILIFIVTYNASFRLQNIMKKIKKLNLKKDIYKVLISDDCSKDNTIDYIKKFKNLKNTKIILNKKNLGYGGNIKKCLSYAIKKKFNYAIMIHGDDQYDSKYIPEITKKLKNKNIDIVTGSRMLKKKDAIKGGMPRYKFFGNIVLTQIFNIISKTNFTDAHTGLWGYNLKIFEKINLNKINDGYNFDNLLRIQAVKRRLKVVEIPIKTFYRTEASSYHLIYSLDFLKNLIVSIFKK
jgi:hypothetical protein